MTMQLSRLNALLDVLQQANAAACSPSLTTLLDQTLDLLRRTSEARSVHFYEYDQATASYCHRVAQAVHADLQHDPLPAGYLQAALGETRSPLRLAADGWPELLAYPLAQGEVPIGVLLFDGAMVPDDGELDLVPVIIERLTPDIARAMQHAAALRRNDELQHMNTRLKELIAFIGRISTTLDRNRLIKNIMDYAERLLQVEATSFWLLDKNGEHLELLVAGGDNQGVVMPRISIPSDKGIIGHVVTRSQEREIVNDVHTSPHFHARVDNESGFVTRSILCVPMRAPSIERSAQQGGDIQEHIIGGAQALNKRDDSPFTEEDAQLFETLTRQAAIAFQFSQLFEEQEKLFWGIVRAISTAADLKDPSFSPGHSHRVALLSVAIARELGCSEEMIARVRVGSRLHDLGKVGISDIILGKQSRLDEAEMNEIRKHPQIGYDLLVQAGLGELLEEELHAVIEHHERLDGKGYPCGLVGDQISLLGRIVSVADVFDALTNDRPYRKALTMEETLVVLHDMEGSALDPACVAALERACLAGRVVVPMPLDELGDGYAPSGATPAPSHR